MTQHFTRSTVSASFWCSKCRAYTQHRIDSGKNSAGRKGPCLECIARLDKQHAQKAREHRAEQQSLWEDAS